MANVSSSNGLEKRPKLRFPGFDEPWKEISLLEIGRASSGIGFPEKYQGENSTEIPFFKVSDMNLPLNSRILLQSNNYISKETAKRMKAHPFENDAIVFAKVGAAISHERKRIAHAPFLIDNNMMAFTPNCHDEIAFMYHLFQRLKLSKYAQLGALPSYNADDILSIRTFVPQFKQEREKIVQLFDCIGQRLDKQMSLINALKKYKRGLSNSLFYRLSAESQSHLCIFGDMMTILQNNTFSRDNLSVGGDGVRNIHYGDVLIKYGAAIDLHNENIPVINANQDISKFSALSYLRNGDVVFADTAEDYTVGKATEILGAENLAALSGLHTIPCRPQKNFAPMYLGYYFNSDYFKKQLYPMIQGTKVSSISKSEIVKTKIIVPCLQKQTRIASIMSALDKRIDAAERTTKDLADLRSGLLQQLFI